MKTGKQEQRRSGKRASLRSRALHAVLNGLFGGAAQGELVSTHINVSADPDAVWKRIALYEDVMTRPPLLLRIIMPCPIRTEGDKSRAGVLVRCVYDGGYLVKRILAVEPPYRMVFDVLEQRLGIESCVIAQQGSYEIDRVRDGCDVVLTTQYRAFLHPRWLWRPLERMIASKLHLHILHAMEKGESEAEFSGRLGTTSTEAGAATQAATETPAAPPKKPSVPV